MRSAGSLLPGFHAAWLARAATGALATVLVCLGACEAPETAPADAGPDASLEIQSRTEALSVVSECGDISGLQADAVWPMRGGCPTHAAQSEDKGPGQSSENWRVSVSGAIKSSAVIGSDGTLYVASGGARVYRFNPATGQKLREGSGFFWGGMRSTPALATRSLIVGTDLGKVLALNPTTLSASWTYQAWAPFSASPVVLPSGDVVAASEDFSLYLINALNGKKRWSYKTGLSIIGSPAIDPASSAIVFGSTDGSLYALNTDGTLKWKTSLVWPVAATPLIAEGRVYVGAGNQLHCLDVATGQIVWQTSLEVSLVGSPSMALDGTIYLPSTTLTGGALFAIEPDGSVLWRFNTSAGIESTPTVDVDGRLYFGTNESKVYALDKRGKLLWSRAVDGKVTGSPVIVKGGHAIVVGTDAGSFYSLGKKSPDVCGDGVVTGVEECDTALSTLCTEDCKKGPATSCTANEDCPEGQLCGFTNSGLFGLEGFEGVCWPAFCNTSPASACGTTASACGLCVCQPSCAGKTCSADRDNGCGSTCFGLCGTAAICKGDSDCRSGQTCGFNNGVYFAQPLATRVCWDALCDLGGGEGIDCGSLSCIPNCDAKTCGNDGCGGSCGSCDGQCVDGQCVIATPLDATIPGRPLPIPLSLVAPSETSEVGTLPGAASVSSAGAAEYTIPIEVPPAPGGMQPHLSLTYSSGRANGLVGVGWSLTGPELSVISRCPRTSLDPGGAQPVSYTAADKFCLDGMPLVEVPGSPSGPFRDIGAGAGSVRLYRTQLDSFSLVAAVIPRSNDQPSRWVVLTKDGLTKSYGGTLDSRVMHRAIDDGDAQDIGSEWALDSVTDRSGNRMTIGYSRNRLEDQTAPLSSDIIPAVIRYGTFSGPNTSDRKVLFTYESVSKAPERRDVITGYRGGRRYRRSRLLTNIFTLVAHVSDDDDDDDDDERRYRFDTVRSYQLGYKHIPARQAADDDGVGRPFTEPHRLAFVQVCPTGDRDGCLPPTTFTYGIDGPIAPPRAGFPNAVEIPGFGYGWQKTEKLMPTGLLFDMNGDGKADRAWHQDIVRWEQENTAEPRRPTDGRPPIQRVEPAGLYLDIGETPGEARHPQDGFANDLIATQDAQIIRLVTLSEPIGAFDLNDDRFGDLIYADPGRHQIVVLWSNGERFVPVAYPTASTDFEREQWSLVDIDGDGYQDLFRCGESLGFLRNNGYGFDSEQVLPSTATLPLFGTGPLLCANQGGKGRPTVLDTDGDGVDNILFNFYSSSVLQVPLVAVRFEQRAGNWVAVAVNTGLSGRMVNDPGKTKDPLDAAPVLIDLNADGLRDMLVPRNQSDQPESHYQCDVTGTAVHDTCYVFQAWINTGGPQVVFRDLGVLVARTQDPGKPEVNLEEPGTALPVTTPSLALAQSAQVYDYDGDGRQDLIIGSVIRWHPGQDGDDVPAHEGWHVFRGFREIVGTRTGQAEFAHTSWLTTTLGLPNSSSTAPIGDRVELADFDGNGTIDVLVSDPGRKNRVRNPGWQPSRWYGLSEPPLRMQLRSVTNGLGRRDEFQYAFGPGEHYVPQTDDGCIYGVRCVPRLSSAVVRFHAMGSKRPNDEAPAAIQRHFEYRYTGLRFDALRRTSVGFAEVRARELSRASEVLSTTSTQFDQRRVRTKYGLMFPFASRAKSVVRDVRVKDGDLSRFPSYLLRNQTTYDWKVRDSDAAVPFVFMQGSTVTSSGWGVGQTGTDVDLVVERQSAYEVDAYGNTWSATDAWPDATYTATTIEFDHSADRIGRWQVDLPKLTYSAFISSTRPAVQRRVGFEYDARGLLSAITREPYEAGNSSWILLGNRTEFGRDPSQHYNITDIREYGLRDLAGGDNDRITHLDWFTDSVVPDRITNDLGHVTDLVVDRGTGATLATTGPDGIEIKWKRDVYGRIYEEHSPLGVSKLLRETASFDPGGLLAVDAVYKVTQTAPDRDVGVADAAIEIMEFNSFGMPVRTSTDGLLRPTLRQELSYDIRGFLQAVSRPHEPGSRTQGVVRFARDDAGRLLRTNFPDNTVVENVRARAGFLRPDMGFIQPSYGDSIEGIINPRGFMRLSHVRSRGLTAATFEETRLASETEPQWNATRYAYTDFDSLWRIQDPEGQVTELERDLYGRITKRVDPASGTTQFFHDAFDQLYATIDAKSQRVDLDYDSIGRLIERRGPSGTSSWTWDCIDGATCNPQDLGKLVQSTRGDVTTQYTFNPRTGMQDGMQMSIAGQGTFSTHAEYLGNGLPDVMRIDAPGASFAVQFDYDPQGGTEATKLTNVSAAAAGSPLWEITDDYEGLAPQLERLGNGLYRRTLYETLTGRVQRTLDGTNSARVGQAANLSDTFYTYDDNGNLKSVGRLGDLPSLRTYDYDPLDRLKSVKQLGGLELEAYDYDLAGNLTAKLDLGSYTYHDGPRPGGGCSLTQAASCDGVYDVYRPHALRHAGDIDFDEYDDNGNEELRTSPEGSLRTEYTDFNLPSRFIPDEDPAEAIDIAYDADENRVITRAPGKTTVYLGDIYQRTVDATGTKHEFFFELGTGARLHVVRDASGEKLEYILKDHLGSSTQITSATGALLSGRTFSSYGESNGAALEADAPGFTGHRLDAAAGLINMKGRIYDPKIGRFTQPDPITALPFGDGLNRYAYVLNNPLKYIDPWGLQASIPCQEAGTPCPGDTPPDPPTQPNPPNDPLPQITADALARLQRTINEQALGSNQPGAPGTTGQELLGGRGPERPDEPPTYSMGRPDGSENTPVAPGSMEQWDFLYPDPISVDRLSMDKPRPTAGQISAYLEAWNNSPAGQEAREMGMGASAAMKVAGGSAIAIAKHHAWPKYLGGAAKQELVPLAKKLHEAFHSGLDKILPRQWGTKYYEKLVGTAKTQMLQDLADYTRAFDAKHGTQIYEALLKAGFPAP